MNQQNKLPEKKKKEHRFDPELLKKGLRCDLDQYEMLKRCSDKRDITEWNEWRKEHPDEEIWLEGANFVLAHLKGAQLWEAHLKGVKLMKANLKGANLNGAHLEQANLDHANLKGADLNLAYLKDTALCFSHLERANLDGSHLEDARFGWAIVDGATLLRKCEVNSRTDFHGVGLDSIRIDTGTKQLLEYNIRRKNWEEWYPKHIFLRWLVHWFWSLSDYGRSTGRIIWSFILLAFGFSIIYLLFATLSPPGIVSNLSVVEETGQTVTGWLLIVRSVYFSVVTMTTLGFGDMYANAHSIWGHILLTIQVILGYVLLGALVTRFAVLFTAGGPAGKFTDEKRKQQNR